MRKSLRYAFRLLVIVAAVAALPALLGPASPAHSPYLSALSNLTAGSVLASSHCPDKACASFGGPCAKTTGYICANSGGQCFTRLCQ